MKQSRPNFLERVRSAVSAYQHPFTPNFPTAPPQGQLPQTLLQPPGSRPSYDLAGTGAFLGPTWHIPLAQDYRLYAKLREAIPIIDTAIVRLRELVGVPIVEGDETLVQDVNAWLTALPVNRSQVGFANWVATWIDDSLTYGRSHAEIVLNNQRNDVAALLEIHPSTCALRPRADGASLDVVQYQSMGGVPVLMNPDLHLMAVNDVRTDDPNGASLMFSLPFVGEVLNGMVRSLGQTWGRFGSPSYHVNWEPPDDWNDPQGEQAAKILAAMQGNFETAMQDRANGTLRDFFSSGKVTVTIVGAAGEELEFEGPARSLVEWIVAKTGLPPFVFGFQWATTERLSTMQAILLHEIIQSIRDQVGPKLRRLVDLRQALVGRTGDYKLTWPQTSLQDRMEEARADWMDAQAQQIEIGNWKQLGQLGIYSTIDAARHFRPELSDLDDAEVKLRLPDLEADWPEPEPVLPAAAGMPPEGPASPSGEGTRALPGRRRSLTYANGNGSH